MRCICGIILAAVLTAGSFLAAPFAFAQSAAEINEINFSPDGQDKAGFVSFAAGEGAPVLYVVIKSGKVLVYIDGQPREFAQEISYDPRFFQEMDIGEFIELEDMNFDGYTDMKIMASKGNINIFYDCWLWNQDKKIFALNEELSDLSLPEFDSKTKTIATYTHYTATDNAEATYTFRNGKLEPVKITVQSYDGKRDLFIIKVYAANEKGKLRLVSEDKFTQKEMEEKTSER